MPPTKETKQLSKNGVSFYPKVSVDSFVDAPRGGFASQESVESVKVYDLVNLTPLRI